MFRVICISFLCIVLLSCKNVYEEDNFGDLYIQFASLDRTLQPEMDTEISIYTITFSNSVGIESFTIDLDKTSTKITDLYTCNWDILVEAKNVSGEIIGSGSGSIEILKNETTELNVEIIPFTGDGTFNLTVEWVDPTLEDVLISATLVDEWGTEEILTLEIIPDTLSVISENNILSSGYYQLTLTMEVSGETVIGLTEKVKIVKDKITNGSFLFNKI